MSDQAEDLRRLARARRGPGDTAGDGGTPVWVIGSGKGGVGKSTLALMLAAALAREGRETLLLDGAQNQGNLHVLAGVRPALQLDLMRRGEVAAETLLTPLAERLTLLPAASGDENLYGLPSVDQARLHHRMTSLYERFDAVVVDAPHGIEGAIRVAAMRANRLQILATPDPAALSDAYALLKIAHLQLPSVPVGVIVNRAEDEADGAAAFERLRIAAGRFLHRQIAHTGTVCEDTTLRAAARTSGALLGQCHPVIDGLAARMAAAAEAA